MRRWSGTASACKQFRLQQSAKKNDGENRQAAITAISILLFTKQVAFSSPGSPASDSCSLGVEEKSRLAQYRNAYR
jgi:hypothetical protein